MDRRFDRRVIVSYFISKFIIAQDMNDDEVLLYSTLSTSIIVLEKKIYIDIFNNKEFDKYADECQQLSDMGFLYTGDINKQHNELCDIRKSIVEAEHGITAITIAPTMECNARCYYCFEHGAKQGRMTIETADAVSEFLIKNCTEKKLYIAWFGGEPLMASEIISYISSKLYAAGIDIESTVTTNGILIDESFVELFREWKVTRVQITIDGLGEEYNRIKNYSTTIDNPFEKILENIRLLINNNFTVHLRANYLSTNYDNVNKTMDYLHDEFGDYEKLYIYGVPLDLPQKKGYSEFDEQEGEIFLKVLDDSLKKGYENDELNFAALKVSEEYNKALGELMLAPFPASCYMVNKDRYVIDDQGLLYKCQKHLGKSDFNCGNVFDGVDKNKIYEYYVTEQLNDENCHNCRMLPICQGGCKANRLLYGSKFACPPSKSIIEKLVMKYYEYLINDNQY